MAGKLFIGIDVSGGWIDIAVFGGAAVTRVANREEAIEGWIAGLAPAAVGLVAFEPTGGHERTLRRLLHAAGLPFARVHPNEVAAFRPTPRTRVCWPTSRPSSWRSVAWRRSSNRTRRCASGFRGGGSW